ncbi:MAG: hypothetical protein NW241_18700 [Bacteroidia bacterium]|nr:hypothetical protein [Bacteroidia bacterium]
MRSVKAYMLLATLLLSWAERFVFLEVTEYVEVRHVMNPLEQRIADELLRTYGIRSAVQLAGAPEMPVRGAVYGDQAFSIEIGGQTHYYMLVDEARSTTYQQITRSEPVSSEEQEREMVLLKKLTSEHFASAQEPLPAASEAPLEFAGFYADRPVRLVLPVPVPPPDQA